MNRFLGVGLLWLSIGLGCKKEDTSPQYCSDGTCCTPTTEKYQLAGKVQGSLAYFRSQRLVEIQDRFPANSSCFSSVASVCQLSWDKITGVSVSQNFVNPEHKYRVWGTVYYRTAETFTCVPTIVINVDRIEEVR